MEEPYWEVNDDEYEVIDMEAEEKICNELITKEQAFRVIADSNSSTKMTLACYDELLDGIATARAVEVEPIPHWIPVSGRLPETDNTNEINEFDVLLAVRPKKHPEETPQVYIGKLRPVKGDDGSGNVWGIKTAPCEWTIWGWSYFQEPEVLAWMPLPKPYKGE